MVGGCTIKDKYLLPLPLALAGAVLRAKTGPTGQWPGTSVAADHSDYSATATVTTMMGGDRFSGSGLPNALGMRQVRFYGASWRWRDGWCEGGYDVIRWAMRSFFRRVGQ